MKNKKYFKWCEAILNKARYGTSKGLSILISVVLVSLVVLFSIGVTTLVTESTRQSANIKQGTTAYYAAEAGIEQALWVNQKLASSDSSIGANEQISQQAVAGSSASTNFKIQGTTTNLVEKTVNGQYIIPFPWTGNVPWHGEGAVAGSGGCNPEKPPTRSGTGDSKTFTYPPNGVPSISYDEKEHPCNWGRLKVGEKAVIPLFGVTGGAPTNFTSFTLKMRAPCKDGQEFCVASDRMELNCFDKGTNEKICGQYDSQTKQWTKGEVVVSWEIDGDNGSSLLPKQNVDSVHWKYFPDDSQLYEGKINQANTANYQVLDETADGILGGDIGTPKKITAFLSDTANIKKPVLKISVVGSLVGCFAENSCNSGDDNPYTYDVPQLKNSNYHGPNGIPYLEYQVVLPSSAATNPPANLENVISAEGQSGPFNQTIQVKVPNDNSTLEYVIQQ